MTVASYHAAVLTLALYPSVDGHPLPHIPVKGAQSAGPVLFVELEGVAVPSGGGRVSQCQAVAPALKNVQLLAAFWKNCDYFHLTCTAESCL